MFLFPYGQCFSCSPCGQCFSCSPCAHMGRNIAHMGNFFRFLPIWAHEKHCPYGHMRNIAHMGNVSTSHMAENEKSCPYGQCFSCPHMGRKRKNMRNIAHMGTWETLPIWGVETLPIWATFFVFCPCGQLFSFSAIWEVETLPIWATFSLFCPYLFCPYGSRNIAHMGNMRNIAHMEIETLPIWGTWETLPIWAMFLLPYGCFYFIWAMFLLPKWAMFLMCPYGQLFSFSAHMGNMRNILHMGSIFGSVSIR